VGRIEQLTGKVKALALAEGFDRAGIAPADPVKGRDDFERWLAAGRSAGMSFLARDPAVRFCPRRLVAGAVSVICLAVSYAPDGPDEQSRDRTMPFVAKYARGRDYHKVLKKRCRALMRRLREEVPGFVGKAFVDTAPVAERSLAAAAGIGWIGRNGCLIVPGLGSYVVLAEIVCNIELQCDRPMEPKCGQCDACISACPTGALLGDGSLDAGRCLSYLTIEHRGPIDERFLPRWGLRVFGCDSCQDACPHNRSVKPGDKQLRNGCPRADLSGTPLHRTRLADVLAWDEDRWDAATTGSATRRAGLDVLLRNAVIAAGNSGDAELIAPLRELARRKPEFGKLVDWACSRLS